MVEVMFVIFNALRLLTLLLYLSHWFKIVVLTGKSVFETVSVFLTAQNDSIWLLNHFERHVLHMAETSNSDFAVPDGEQTMPSTALNTRYYGYLNTAFWTQEQANASEAVLFQSSSDQGEVERIPVETTLNGLELELRQIHPGKENYFALKGGIYMEARKGYALLPKESRAIIYDEIGVFVRNIGTPREMMRSVTQQEMSAKQIEESRESKQNYAGETHFANEAAASMGEVSQAKEDDGHVGEGEDDTHDDSNSMQIS